MAYLVGWILLLYTISRNIQVCKLSQEYPVNFYWNLHGGWGNYVQI